MLVWVQVPSSAHFPGTTRDAPTHHAFGYLGRLAQLAEHGVYTAGVGGSSPSPPTSHLARIWAPAEIAQLVEHATENRSVHSSILCLGTARAIWPVLESGLNAEVAQG